MNIEDRSTAAGAVRYFSRAILILLLIGIVQSCEYPFDPLEKNDEFYFSMYGLFDPASDTQFVRVMPVRQTLVAQNEDFEATVTLTNLDSGTSTQLRDSVFVFRASGQDNFYAHNFWTDTAIEYETNYRIRAEYPDGRYSEADFYIPPIFTPPTVSYNEATRSGLVEGGGVENLVIAEITYYVKFLTPQGPTPQNIIKVSQIERERVVFLANGNYRFVAADMGYIADRYWNGNMNTILLDSAEVLIGNGSDDWPEFNILTEEEAALPTENTNVKQGVGLVIGASTVLIPFEECMDMFGETVPCPVKN